MPKKQWSWTSPCVSWIGIEIEQPHRRSAPPSAHEEKPRVAGGAAWGCPFHSLGVTGTTRLLFLAKMQNTEDRIRASFVAQGLMTTIGAKLDRVADGEVQISMPFSKSLSQQQGFVHAGAITSIVDSACGYAALTKAPAGFEVVTAEFKVNLLRPAIGTRFVAIGKVQNAGKLLTVCTGEVRAFKDNDESFKVVAIMQATFVNVSA